MSDRQIQPVRRDLQLIRQGRPRSLWSQVWTVALQPNTFFQTLPQAQSGSRQWFWVAVLILALTGFSAVRQEALRGGSTTTPDFSGPPVTDFGDPFSGGGSGGSGDFSGLPGPIPGGDTGGLPTIPEPSGGGDIASTWVTALISGSHIVLGWAILSILLCEVSLFNGVRPNIGQNIQIAIWATVPLGIMAGLQLVYYAAGGQPGTDGIAGLLPLWSGYDQQPQFFRSLLLSLTSRGTLFWLWSLVLLYIAARVALQGKHWAIIPVVLAWVVILTVVPVLTGAVAAPEVASSDSSDFPPIVDDLSPDALPTQAVLPGEDLGMTPESADFGPTPEGLDIVLPETTPEPGSDADADASSTMPPTPAILKPGSAIIVTVPPGSP
ncbi:MAG: hypothetical protein JNM70_02975 [Anaerolineae bacterium]|nr:hypothetical protein [Anaerolineae bacterium]